MASDDALSLLRNDEMHRLVSASESIPPMDEVLSNLAVERNGGDVTAATCENQDMALIDALQTMNDECIRHPRPVNDAVHQEDAPYVKERKGLVIGRGIAGEVASKRNERQETFIRTVADAN
jgi:hypothetical protein